MSELADYFVSKGGMCYVTGEVRSPGAYPCKDEPTVLKLIALAGGFTGKAAKSNVNIVRVVDGEKKKSAYLGLILVC